MCRKNHIRQTVSYADSRNYIKPEKGEVSKVILIQGLVLKVSMDEPESAQGLFTERIIREVRDKNAFCVTDNDMRDIAGPVYQSAYLTACSERQVRYEFCKFRRDYLVKRNSFAIDPFEKAYICALESCCISVKSRYSPASISVFVFILSHYP